MTQQQNPLPTQQQPTSQQQTTLGRRTKRILMNVWEPLDLLGSALMGGGHGSGQP
jgi:hypothetical protein